MLQPNATHSLSQPVTPSKTMRPEVRVLEAQIQLWTPASNLKRTLRPMTLTDIPSNPQQPRSPLSREP